MLGEKEPQAEFLIIQVRMRKVFLFPKEGHMAYGTNVIIQAYAWKYLEPGTAIRILSRGSNGINAFNACRLLHYGPFNSAVILFSRTTYWRLPGSTQLWSSKK